jgi:tetratricopeptide (TPR) repeat protein
MSVLSRVGGRLLCGLVVLSAAALLIPASGAAQSTSEAGVPDSAFGLVDSLRADGEFRDALARLRTLRADYGDEVGVLWRMSLTKVDSAKSTDVDSRVKALYREALNLADEALAVDSSAAHAHHAKAVAEGRIALDAGRKERVRRSRAVKRHADRAIELDSTLDGAYHVRARWHREVADLGFLEKVVVKTVYGGLPDASIEQCIQDFERAIQLNDERLHRLELAKTYVKLDREEDAKKQLRALLDLPPRGAFDEGYGYQAQQMLNGFE